MDLKLTGSHVILSNPVCVGDLMSDSLCNSCKTKLECAVSSALLYSGPKNDILRAFIDTHAKSTHGETKVPDCYTLHVNIPYCDTYVSGETCNKESCKSCQN